MKSILFMLMPFLFICIFNGGLTIAMRTTFGKSLPSAFMLSVEILYVTQLLFQTFRVGMVLLYIGAAISLVLIVCRIKDSRVREQVFSTGFYAFCVVFLFFFFVDFARVPSNWDEVSHWGKMTKELIRLDRFYTEPDTYLLAHREYPPFIAILEMFWCKLCGKYSEMGATMALHTFCFSMLVPVMADEWDRNKKVITAAKSLGTLALIYLLLLSFDPMKIYPTLYLELVVAVLFAYAVYLIISKEFVQTRVGALSFSLVVGFMIMTKEIEYAFILLVIFLCLLFIALQYRKNRKQSLHALLACSAALLVTGGNIFAWKHYVSQFDITGQFDFSHLSLTTMLAILTGRQQGLQHETMLKFIKALFETDIFSGSFVITFFSSLLVVLCVLALIFVCHRNRAELSDAVSLGVLFICGTAGYAFTMLTLYMFCFDSEEMGRLADYGRYMASYVVAELLVLMFYYHITKAKTKSEWTVKHYAAFILAAIVLLDSSKFSYMIPQRLKGNPMGEFQTIASELEKETEAGCTIFIISGDKERYQFYVNYFLNDRKVDRSLIGFFTWDLSDADRHARALETIGRCNYVYTAKQSDEQKEYLAGLLAENEEWTEKTLYKVTQTDGKTVLSRVE